MLASSELESIPAESQPEVRRHSTKRHLTTLVGPQAEAILKMLDETGIAIWEDRSVPGVTIVEWWTE